jgi:uncharacterized membrane protein HdeD (DUF308 family)
MTSAVKTPDLLRDTIRDASTAWWWLVPLGAVWIWFGMFVLSYKVGSLVAVSTFVGTAFLFGGITQLVVASRVPTLRWLSILDGILGVVAGIATFVWPDITLYAVSIMVAWYLIVYGIIHTLVGVWATCRGVNEIFAGFTLRQVGKQADRLVA